MLLTGQEIKVPTNKGSRSLLEYFSHAISGKMQAGRIPVRFAVTQSDAEGYNCELGVLEEADAVLPKPASIFDFNHRDIENTDSFNAVMIVPTGIGAEIGGHAGDATPAARMIASVCDTLITHPNVVNASDINELPENGLYVEGSVLTRLLMGTAGLKRVRKNRVLLAIDKHQDKRLEELCINASAAARTTLGSDCPTVVKIDPPMYMEAKYSSSGSAVGIIEGLERLCEVWLKHGSEFDALAVASVVKVPEGFHWDYFLSTGKMVNPWGGIEAMLTHTISMLFDIPSAHAPMMESIDIANLHVGVVDPRMSAEAVSTCFLHCVLKGLHRSPKVITDRMLFAHPGILTAADISCVVIPDGCLGLPTLAALEQGIPVIAVRENRNRMKNDLTKLPFRRDKLFIVENYLEAAGVTAAIKAGIALSSVRRPLPDTQIICDTPTKKNNSLIKPLC
jgi:hypothetical protein